MQCIQRNPQQPAARVARSSQTQATLLGPSDRGIHIQDARMATWIDVMSHLPRAPRSCLLGHPRLAAMDGASMRVVKRGPVTDKAGPRPAPAVPVTLRQVVEQESPPGHQLPDHWTTAQPVHPAPSPHSTHWTTTNIPLFTPFYQRLSTPSKPLSHHIFHSSRQPSPTLAAPRPHPAGPRISARLYPPSLSLTSTAP